MGLWKNYLQPGNIEDALQSMASAKSSLAVISGGTDLILDIEQGRHAAVDTMIDVTCIPEMHEIRLVNDLIFLGASVTLVEIIQSRILNEHAQCVVESCGLMGGPQVRNVATIGGNVAHALPAGDGIISLLALGTEVQIASLEGRRWQSLEEIFAAPGQTTFDRNRELVIGFRFPVRKAGEASAFSRLMRPQGVAIAILNMAVWVRGKQPRLLQDIRIAMGPAGPRPLRARETEKFLKDKQLDENTFQQACRILDDEVQLRTSPHRATAEYRHHLLPILFKQVIEIAVGRVSGNPREFSLE